MASLEDKITGALFGMFAGDALAFPLHWYYDQKVLKEHREKHYNGSLDKYYAVAEEVKDKHPNSKTSPKSILEKNEPAVVALIKEENKALWATESIHWNATLSAGENSNTSQIVKLLVDSLVENGGEYKPLDYTKRYIDFFKNHRHNDLYFEGIHQGYFTKLAAGKGQLEAGRDGETCLSGHSLSIPLSLLLHKDREAALKAVKKHISLSHISDDMATETAHLAGLFIDLLEGKDDPKALFLKTAKALDASVDLETVGAEAKEDLELYGYDKTKDNKPFSIHCYRALPGLLYLAYKYFDDPKQALIANANMGGDNTDRGSALGALLGAAKGSAWIPQEWKDGLRDPVRADLPAFVDKFAKLVVSKAS